MSPCKVLAWSVTDVVLIIVTSDEFDAMSYGLQYLYYLTCQNECAKLLIRFSFRWSVCFIM